MSTPDVGGGSRRKAWFLVGPTASGKTAAAHLAARAAGCDVLSADASAVYRGMDIGTAKPSAVQRAEITYRGLDLADPDQTFSTGAFLEEAARAARAGRPLIVCGGTGLYIRALTAGLDAGPPPEPGVRAAVLALHAAEGEEGLRNALRREAPERLHALKDPENPRRLLRALELARSGARETAGPEKDAFRPALVGLRLPRDVLDRRIRQRIVAMFDGGLLEEAQSLRQRFARLSETAAGAIGYREAFAVLDGGLGQEEAIEQAFVRTRQLAKRQMTWFRNQARMHWIDLAGNEPAEEIAGRARAAWEVEGATELAV